MYFKHYKNVTLIKKIILKNIDNIKVINWSNEEKIKFYKLFQKYNKNGFIEIASLVLIFENFFKF